jgi:hypothetical protein
MSRLDGYKEALFDRFDITLWLNSYEDIFSDFDPRPYSKKALSSDFLEEMKRASVDKVAPIPLVLLVPKSDRNRKSEKVIKKRLKEHFQKHNLQLSKQRVGIMKEGASFAVAGFIIMLVASFILFKYEESFLKAVLITVFDPAGWFLFWRGLELILFESKNKTPDFTFYNKMEKSNVYFRSY